MGVMPMPKIAMRKKKGSSMENSALRKLWSAPDRTPITAVVAIPRIEEKKRTLR